MKKITKLTSLILTFALCLGLTSSLTACAPEETLNGSLNTEIADSERVKLMSSDVVVNSEEGYLEQTLTATVYPTSVPESQKLVDWDIVWSSNTTEQISDYLTITPESDGSNVCVVRCIKAFEIPAIITVKTRVGGYIADCVVTYVGKPTKIIPSSADGNISDSIFTIGLNQVYNLNFEAYNELNSVGDNYKNLIVEFNCIGTIELDTYQVNLDSGEKTWWEQPKTVNASDLLSELFTVNISGNSISITANKDLNNYYESSSLSGRIRTYFNKVKSLDNVSFYITAIEPNTYVERLITINVDSTIITDVQLLSSLEF